MGSSEAAAIYRNAVLLKCPPGAQRKLPVIWIWLTVSLGCGVLPVLLHKVCLGWTTSHEQTLGLQSPKQAALWVPGGPPSQAAPGFLCPPRAGGGSSQFTKISRGRWSRRVGVGSQRRAGAQLEIWVLCVVHGERRGPSMGLVTSERSLCSFVSSFTLFCSF